jgi:hypothetical protein
MALEQVAVGKVVKLEVVVEANVADSGTWKPKDFANRCTADGDYKQSEKVNGKLLPTAPSGALIARIGGSTATSRSSRIRRRRRPRSSQWGASASSSCRARSAAPSISLRMSR